LHSSVLSSLSYYTNEHFNNEDELFNSPNLYDNPNDQSKEKYELKFEKKSDTYLNNKDRSSNQLENHQINVGSNNDNIQLILDLDPKDNNIQNSDKQKSDFRIRKTASL